MYLNIIIKMKSKLKVVLEYISTHKAGKNLRNKQRKSKFRFLIIDDGG